MNRINSFFDLGERFVSGAAYLNWRYLSLPLLKVLKKKEGGVL